MIGINLNWHTIFVQFLIALATAAVTFTIAGKLFSKRAWASPFILIGRWMLWGAALALTCS